MNKKRKGKEKGNGKEKGKVFLSWNKEEKQK